MAKVYGWSPTEMLEREEAFAALVDAAVTRVTKKVATRLADDRVVVAAGAPAGSLPPVEPVPPPPIDLGSVAAITAMWNGVVSAELMPALTETYLTSASAVYQGASYAFPGFMIPPVSDVFAEDYLAAATNRLVGIGDLVWQNVRQELLVGFSLGEGITKLRDRVVAAGNVSQARANVIARTEVNAASNAGAQQQVMISGLVGTKEWLDTNDARTRCSHKHAGGQTVAIDQPFRVGGPECKTGYSFLMQPGDPTAPPGEIIQCRCSVAYDLSLPAGEEDPLADLEISVSGNVGALTAAAEVHTGAMIALVPEDPTSLALDGFEPADELHVTMMYLGEAVAWSPEHRRLIQNIVAHLAETYAPVVTETFSVNIFNPNSDDTDTAIVLGVRGAPSKLTALHNAIRLEVEDTFDDGDVVPEQHTPWIPHITLAYTDDMSVIPEAMTRLGTIAFNRLRCAFGGVVTDYPLDGIIVAAGKSIWKEAEHPRGHDGKFIKGAGGSGLLDTLLDLVTSKKLKEGAIVATWNANGSKRRLRVTEDTEGNPGVALQEIMGGKWENVSSTYAYDKKTIQSWLDDAHAGKNLTLSPQLEEKKLAAPKAKTLDPKAIWDNLDDGEYQDDQIIAEGSITGGTKVRLVAKVDPYSGKSSIVEEYKTSGNDWVENDIWHNSTEFAKADLSDYTLKPDATLVKAPGPSAAEVAIAKGDFSGLKKISGPKGSNEGGLFEAPDGSRWYVKKQKSAKHAENEKLAADLYRAAGIDAPEIYIGGGTPGLSSGTHTASRIIDADPGTSLGKVAKGGDTAKLTAVREGFAMDALLANWDVAGLEFDNVIFDADGKPHRIDVGGALEFRAQGAPKGSAFGTTVGEWDSLRSPSNPQSAKLFKDMTSAELSVSVDHVEKLTPEKIHALVKDKKLADKLIARREDLLKRAHEEGVLSALDSEPSFHPVNDHMGFDIPASPEAAKLGLTDEEFAALKAKVEVGTDVTDAPSTPTYVPHGPLKNGDPKKTWQQLKKGLFADGDVIADYDDDGGDIHRLVVEIPMNGKPRIHEQILSSDGTWGTVQSYYDEGAFVDSPFNEPFGFPAKGVTPPSSVTHAENTHLGLWQKVASGGFSSKELVGSYVDEQGWLHELRAGMSGATPGFLHTKKKPGSGNTPDIVDVAATEDDFLAMDLSKFVKPGTEVKPKALTKVPKLTNAVIYGKYQEGDVIATHTGGYQRVVYKNNKIVLQGKAKGSDPWKDVDTWGKAEAYKKLNGASFGDSWYLGDPTAMKGSPGDPLVTTSAVKKVVTPPPAPPVVTPAQAVVSYAHKVTIKGTFAKKGVKWHTASGTMLEAAVEAQKKHPELSLGQILAVMDTTTSTQTSPTPFTDKIKKYLNTKAGKHHAKHTLGLPSDTMTKIGSTNATSKPGTSVAPPISSTPVPGGTTVGVIDAGTHTYLAPPGGFPIPSAKEMPAIQAEMHAKYGDWTTSQRAALKKYTGSSYKIMNGCLRKPSTCDATTIKSNQNAAAGMRPLTRSIRVARGSGWGALGLGEKQHGSLTLAERIAKAQGLLDKVIVEPGFLSTSSDGKAAFGGELKFLIDVPEGTPAAWVSDISSVGKGEREVLLAPGLKYRIKEVIPGKTGFSSGATPTTVIMEVIYP